MGHREMGPMAKCQAHQGLRVLFYASIEVDDARVTEVVLTKKGREAVTHIRAHASRLFHQAFDGIDAAEVKSLKKILQRISQNLDRTPKAR